MGKMEICRACSSNDLYMFLALGLHPPANQFLKTDQLDAPEPTFPLNAHVCLNCALIQIPNYITADFFRHYVYVPSGAETMREHFRSLASTLVSRLVEDPNDLIVDVGSNEGLFLGACGELGAKALGVEPAANLAKIARANGLEVVNDYFTPDTAKRIHGQYGPAKVIVTTNTFNHIDDLHSFMEGVSTLLSPEGCFVVEVPHSLDLLQKNEFDTIYHEHLSEFSVKSLMDLFETFGVEVFDIERLQIHGGSMRVYAQKKGAGRDVSRVIEDWLAREREARLFSRSTYDDFTIRVNDNRTRLLELLARLKKEGKRLAGYGAPAKGNTLLNYYGIGAGDLAFLADRNVLKQGLYSPGMRIPVVPPEKILEEQPDYLLILAWNFSDEILMQQEEYRCRGGKFILPVPEPVVLG